MLALNREHQSFKPPNRRLRTVCHVACHPPQSKISLHKLVWGVSGGRDNETAARVGIFEWFARGQRSTEWVDRLGAKSQNLADTPPSWRDPWGRARGDPRRVAATRTVVDKRGKFGFGANEQPNEWARKLIVADWVAFGYVRAGGNRDLLRQY